MTHTTTTLTAAALLGLGLLAPTQATAAAPTCGGAPATIVGTPGDRLVGTEGPDVIVSNGALSVEALGGDDRICVTFETGLPYSTVPVAAGPGNDLVDATASGAAVAADLGSGVDTFAGSDLGDIVGVEYPDPGAPDVVQGGGGIDVLDLATAAGAGEVDNVLGRLALGGEVRTTWTDLETFTLSPAEGTSPWRVVGSEADETIGWYPFGTGATIEADLGAGDDAFLSERPPAATSRVTGGAGRDRVYIASTRAALDLDLADGTLAVGGSSGYELATPGFEDADLFARWVTVTGTAGPNSIGLTACRGSVRLGAGDDTVERQYDSLFESDIRCSESLTANGGKGADVMSGTFGPDVLRGGPGHDRLRGRQGRDTAVGGPGRDRCLAERERRCER